MGSEYEDLPRGRVVFNMRTRQYIVYADQCILEKSDVVRKIIGYFVCPATVGTVPPKWVCLC